MFRRKKYLKKRNKDSYENRINNVFKSDLVANARFSEKYELPIIKSVNFKP